MTRAKLLLVTVVLASLAGVATAGADEYARSRSRLAAEIANDARTTSPWTGRKGFSARTMTAMETVPRHLFVPEDLRKAAYLNRPLPIGYGQTISQPYIVALMTDLLDLKGGEKILEVGTGSGYQAAVLAQAGASVFTIEIIVPLAQQAARRFAELGYDTVEARPGDGYYGWQEHAPFDGILVTAAAGHVPPPLIEQLKPGGRMVIPVGGRFLTQQLVLVEKAEDGKVTTKHMLPVRFVPLTGGH
jgi:protein-L-isoaspartate(D-aspartate) O-methyltransferase